MGMFKDLKQMKDAVAAAPDMIDQAQQLQAAALQRAAAQQQAAMAAGVPAGGIGQGITPAPAPGSLERGRRRADRRRQHRAVRRAEPRARRPRRTGSSRPPRSAAERGIAAADWHAAVAGWNQRMAANPAVALEFNRLYQGG